MAGMFYSLQEAADKLGVTEEEVKQLANEGKLREFRDGSNVMFKIDEVEGLAAGTGLDLDDFAMASDSASETDELDQLMEMNTIDDLPGAEADTTADEALDDLLFEDSDEPELQPSAQEPDLPEEGQGAEPISLAPEAAIPHEPDGLDELLELAAETEGPVQPTREEELAVVADDGGLEALDDLRLEEQLGGEAPEPVSGDASGGDLVADDTQVVTLGQGSDEATFEDTALTSEGISVLGESDADFKLTDDTLAETLAGLGGTGDSTSLEDIEDDINLDSFGGSGSGLLDLSLQADDTSLGGILDEIYTSDDGEGAPAGDSIGSTEEVSAGLDAIGGADEGAAEEFVPALGRPIGAEIAPDASSDMLGALLFLPIFVLLYTAVVAVSALRGTVPGILSSIQGYLWYVLGGLALIGLIVGVVGITGGGGGGGPKKPKAKKAKKEPKPKKEKKPKKAKKK